MNKELSKEEKLAELLMQSESVQSSIFLIKEYAEQEKKKEAIAILHWIYPANTDKENEQLYELFNQQK